MSMMAQYPGGHACPGSGPLPLFRTEADERIGELERYNLDLANESLGLQEKVAALELELACTPKSITVGPLNLSEMGEKYWLQHQRGEAMTIPAEDLQTLLVNYWTDNF